MGETTETSNPLPLIARRTPSIVYQCLGLYPRTTPNDSSIGSHTSTQLCNKDPLVTMARPKFTPKLYPFPFDDNHPI